MSKKKNVSQKTENQRSHSLCRRLAREWISSIGGLMHFSFWSLPLCVSPLISHPHPESSAPSSRCLGRAPLTPCFPTAPASLAFLLAYCRERETLEAKEDVMNITQLPKCKVRSLEKLLVLRHPRFLQPHRVSSFLHAEPSVPVCEVPLDSESGRFH